MGGVCPPFWLQQQGRINLAGAFALCVVLAVWAQPKRWALEAKNPHVFGGLRTPIHISICHHSPPIPALLRLGFFWNFPNGVK